GNLLLLLWILAVSVGNVLLRVSSSSTHFVVVFPALALTIALGLSATLDWLKSRQFWRAQTIPDSSAPSPSHGEGAEGEVSSQHSVPSTQHFFLLITFLVLLT